MIELFALIAPPIHVFHQSESHKVNIIMLTCICPGMSSVNHILDSLGYAERSKEKTHQGQGSASSMQSKFSPEQVLEDLRTFLSKYGQHTREDIEAEKKQVDRRLTT